jgi:t-SNARE complex subunit (syntaxin)
LRIWEYDKSFKRGYVIFNSEFTEKDISVSIRDKNTFLADIRRRNRQIIAEG